jgi:hypothetical protein
VRYSVASHCAPKARPNDFMESLSGCVVPRPALSALNRWRPSERKSDTGVDQLSRGSFSAVGSGAPSSARDIDMHWIATLFLIRT